MNYDAMLTPWEAAKHVGVSVSTLNTWAKEGYLTCLYTVGGHKRYSRQSLDSLMRQEVPITRSKSRVRGPSEELVTAIHKFIETNPGCLTYHILDGVRHKNATVHATLIRMVVDGLIIRVEYPNRGGKPSYKHYVAKELSHT